MQDTTNYLFIPQPDSDDDKYSEWRPLQNGRRIPNISQEDPDLAEVTREQNAGERQRKQDKLLLKRNSQLYKFIQMITDFIHYTEVEDVIQKCTSVEWIWQYLRKNYDIETKGVHFLKIAEVKPKEDEPHQAFYRRLRSSFENNLRKSGEIIKHDGNRELTNDERMSPTIESTIVLWALMAIDSRLPAKVDKEFGHLMKENTTLADLQVSIFQRIPHMIKELEDCEFNTSSQLESLQGGMAAVSTSSSRSRGNLCPPRGNFRA